MHLMNDSLVLGRGLSFATEQELGKEYNDDDHEDDDDDDDENHDDTDDQDVDDGDY